MLVRQYYQNFIIEIKCVKSTGDLFRGLTSTFVENTHCGTPRLCGFIDLSFPLANKRQLFCAVTDLPAVRLQMDTCVKIYYAAHINKPDVAHSHIPTQQRDTHLSRVEHTTGFLSGLDWLVWDPVGKVDRGLVNPFEDCGLRAEADQTNPHIEDLTICRTQNIIFIIFFIGKLSD